MSSAFPSNPVSAGDREAGALCPHCGQEIRPGEPVVACPQCGAVQHAACWQTGEGCGMYECAPGRRVLAANPNITIRIKADDLERSAPLPRRSTVTPMVMPPAPFLRPTADSGTSRLAVAALITAVAGIPLFGLVTGLAAVVLGSLAVGQINRSGRRGAGLAITAILLGMADMVGWACLLFAVLGRFQAGTELLDFQPDLASLENVDPRIGRAMKASVLIETKAAWGLGRMVGSGVILHAANGDALVLTNRHVADPEFKPGHAGAAFENSSGGELDVQLLGQPVERGRLVWTAPDGIDLALVRVPFHGDFPQAAQWIAKPPLSVGQTVFSIGNPYHLGWTHTRGVISQLRLRAYGKRMLQVIQTDSALNPGNSGGGLFDEEGRLLGINTWTSDKRVSEGVGFAIAIASFLELGPPLPAIVPTNAPEDFQP